MKLALRFDPQRRFPSAEKRRREERPIRGVHATICRALMKRPGTWALICERPLTERESQSLQTAIYTSSRFDLVFQIHIDDKNLTWARYVAARRTKVAA